MRMEVIANYAYDNHNSIELIIGDRVQLGNLTDPYPNWIFVHPSALGQPDGLPSMCF